MFSAFANCWRIPELRARLIATVALVFVARIGANIPLPGIDPKDIMDYYHSMADKSSGGVVAMYNMFTGGALLKILGTGELTRAVTVKAHRFSKDAKAKIEKAGGKAVLIEIKKSATAAE